MMAAVHAIAVLVALTALAVAIRLLTAVLAALTRLLRLLAWPDIASKESVFQQYDWSVATNTLVGPNLDSAKPAFDLVVTRVSLGKSPMPAFSKAKGGQLEDQQIADVAQYVSTVAGH